MKMSAFAAAAAAASLVILPVAAQAGTKSSALGYHSFGSFSSYGAYTTASVSGKSKGKGSNIILPAAAAGVAGLGIYFAVRKTNDRTPGASS